MRLTNNFVYRISGAISAIRGCLLPIPQCRVNKVKCRWQGTSSSQEGGKESGRLPSLSHDSQTSKPIVVVVVVRGWFIAGFYAGVGPQGAVVPLSMDSVYTPPL